MRDGDAVIGCTLVDTLDLLGGGLWREPRVPVIHTFRREDGKLTTAVAAHGAEGVTPTFARNVSTYEGVTVMLTLAFLGGRTPKHVDRAFVRDLATSCSRATAARFPTLVPGRMMQAALADLAVARQDCAPFLDGLDQVALDHAAKQTFPPLCAETYASLDRTFEAPLLARAVEWFPNLGGMLRGRFASDHPDSGDMRKAIVEGREATWASLAGSIDRWQWIGGKNREGLSGTVLKVATALDALPDATVAEVAARLGATSVLAQDPAAHLAQWLHRLPDAWWPASERQWLLMAECAVAIELGDAGVAADPERFAPHHPDLATYLGVAGNWQALAHRLKDAMSKRDGMRVGDVHEALTDLAERCGRQLVGPAIGLAGRAEGSDGAASLSNPLRAAGMIRPALPFPHDIEAAMAWLKRRDDVDRAVASLSRTGAHSTWAAGLPSGVHDAVEVVVLTSVQSLLYEGMWGRDDGGLAGLDHAMGLRLGPVLGGKERIVSMRTVPKGVEPPRRLATARIGIGRAPWVIDAAGRSGKAMPPEARVALATYMASLTADWAGIDRDALAPRWPADHPFAKAGYDPSVPGAWQAVLKAWEQVLPEALHGLDPETFASMALAVDARLPEGSGKFENVESFEIDPDGDPSDMTDLLAWMERVSKPKS